MTPEEKAALEARLAALDVLIAKRIAEPESASNSMGSVSNRSMDDLYKERDRIDALLNADVCRPPFGRWKLVPPGAV